MAHTNGLESFWSLMKRGYHGTYHQMSPKHLPRYVGEFSGRHHDRQPARSNRCAAWSEGWKGGSSGIGTVLSNPEMSLKRGT